MSSDSFMGNKMAIIAITRNGVALGRRLKPLFPGSHLYLPERFAVETIAGEHVFVLPVKQIVREAFSHYRHLILIMAVGATVRLLASKIRGKNKDPGVVVVDEKGTFVVSLLSGHAGDANELAKMVARSLHAQPVITTASEVSGTIAVDLLGKEFGWELENDDNVTRVAASLVNGDPVGIYQDAGESNWWQKAVPLLDNIHIFTSIEAIKGANCQAALIITDRILDEDYQALLPAHTLIYRPRSLVVGMGCNRGTKTPVIEKAVTQLFAEHGLSLKSIRNIATIDLKKNEAGLLQFAQKYGLPVEYFDKETLSQVAFPSEPSATALKQVGTPAVCETAALLSSRNSSLVIPKANYDRMVSLAVARIPFDSPRSPKRGKLFLVGIGPGDPAQMTLRAREALYASEVVIGYSSYIKLVEPLIAEKEVITSSMTQEVQRARLAIKSAQEGKTVAIIGSGDSGFYGMAGLVGEILGRQGGEIDVEMIPGIPAFVASAALLGAPVTGDFACISLSDYLVPWQEISHRLAAAAQANFVIIIYNPRSKKRQRQLAEAREIIQQYRSPMTPVGIVRNACREGQKVTFTDLQHLLDHEIDMNTTIIIGNSSTFTFDGWMVTPRGYRTKYDLSSDASSAPKSSGR